MYCFKLKSFTAHISRSNLLTSVITVFLFIKVYRLFIVISMLAFIGVILFSLALLILLFTSTLLDIIIFITSFYSFLCINQSYTLHLLIKLNNFHHKTIRVSLLTIIQLKIIQ